MADLENSEIMQTPHTKIERWLDRPVAKWLPWLSIERLFVGLIIILTILSRFVGVGDRTMSHDELNHVVPAYNFSGYVYNPVTHGPFQFHMLALSYALFGDSDFSARVPAASFGVAIVLFTLFAWKRYLGRLGAIVAGFMMMISPYILFYSRYTRNEVFIVFWGVVMLWLFLRYLEDGQPKWLLWLALVTGFHYADKATAYIFTAEACIFLAILFFIESFKEKWKSEKYQRQFVLGFELVILTGLLFLSIYVLHKSAAPAAALAEVPKADMAGAGSIAQQGSFFASRLPLLASALLLLGSVVYALMGLIKGLGHKLRSMRSFNLIALQLLLVLPLMGALVLKTLGFNPEDYSSQGILRSVILLSILGSLAMVLGLKWWRSVWLKAATIFWTVFLIFYTTVFTHGEGFFIGLQGALGYWMSQQAVQRANQPLYYYVFLQVPIYEFLPAIASLTAFIIALKHKLLFSLTGQPFTSPSILVSDEDSAEPQEPALASHAKPLAEEEGQSFFSRLFPEPILETNPAKAVPTVFLLLYWSLMSLLAFTAAGERMPWLTTHITMPMILTGGWAIAWLANHFDWEKAREKNGCLIFGLILAFALAFASLLGSLLGKNPPLQGKDLASLQNTSTFLLALLASLAFGLGLWKALKGWQASQFGRMLLLAFFSILAVLTFRTAWRAAYIDYDNAKEFLVYAHSSEDMKNVYNELTMISKRVSGDLSLKIAYDDDVRYPLQWYTRHFPNRLDYDKQITKTLRDYPVIMVGDNKFDKIGPVVGDSYYAYTYKRMWWPMEDYRQWNLANILNAITNPAMRSALWQIWLNRDYTQYAALTGRKDLTLATWSPAANMRLYIRKDLAAQIWELGAAPQPAAESKTDPYKAGTISLDPVKVVVNLNNKPFNAPRGLAQAKDGSFFVADSRNNQIVHFDSSGKFIKSWGLPSGKMDINAPDGTFNEPWGVAVGTDGNVFVSDTWNHRIQVFTQDGAFVRKWGNFSINGQSDGFWGPRGIAIDKNNHVYVSDTGKQRVVVFDASGNYITQFGSRGLDLGQLDEPVGLAVGADGRVYIADTWNNRVSVFKPNPDGSFSPEKNWEVNAWTSQSIEDKPFLALGPQDDVFVTDPAGGRVLHFDKDGNFIQLWGGFDNSYLIGIVNGLTVSPDGHVWVNDATNNAVLEFAPPPAK
ncbi:MAG: glycosyltransferase family 39 protein [Anaerolineaceae bacterium]|nr:glycosyltransferase family 39 protein [Anaerolineaceae bacterium]